MSPGQRRRLGWLPADPAEVTNWAYPVRAKQQVAVLIGGEQRYVENVEVHQLDAEEFMCMGLDLAPIGDAAKITVEQVTRGQRFIAYTATYSRRKA